MKTLAGVLKMTTRQMGVVALSASLVLVGCGKKGGDLYSYTGANPIMVAPFVNAGETLPVSVDPEFANQVVAMSWYVQDPTTGDQKNVCDNYVGSAINCLDQEPGSRLV